MSGILYGVSVGPGDPELMTLKACRIIRESEVIAVPGKVARESLAYRIACGAVPELAHKQVMSVYFPMTRAPEKLAKSHREGARKLEEFLKKGADVAFLTLGDVSVYSTFAYVQRIVKKDGFETRMISGVPSFCAAAAALGEPLALGEEMIHIVPGAHGGTDDGTYVLMKAGRQMASVKRELSERDMQAGMAENCGMPDERICRSVEDLPDETGYFSVIIAKKNRRR